MSSPDAKSVLEHLGRADEDAHCQQWIKCRFSFTLQWLPPYPRSLAKLKLGGIIGTVEIVNLVESHRSKWFSGPYGLVLTKPRPCKFVRVSGQLGLWNLPARIHDKI